MDVTYRDFSPFYFCSFSIHLKEKSCTLESSVTWTDYIFFIRRTVKCKGKAFANIESQLKYENNGLYIFLCYAYKILPLFRLNISFFCHFTVAKKMWHCSKFHCRITPKTFYHIILKSIWSSCKVSLDFPLLAFVVYIFILSTDEILVEEFSDEHALRS